MKKIHIALATNDIEATIDDYSRRLGCDPIVVVPNEYALWRSQSFNISIRQDKKCTPGELRHLGWEDPSANEFITSTDVNGIQWESFTALQQAEEINEAWPSANYEPGN